MPPGSSRLEEITRLLLEEVAERRRAEESFRVVVEEAPNGIVMVEGDGRIVLVNKAAEALFGYSREELVGQPVEIFVPPAQRRAHPRFRTAYLGSPESRPMGSGRDLTALRKDGTTFPVEIGLNPVETTAGPRILATIIDITERNRAEENFRAVVEEAPNGIVMVDAGGRIVLVNGGREAFRLLPPGAGGPSGGASRTRKLARRTPVVSRELSGRTGGPPDGQRPRPRGRPQGRQQRSRRDWTEPGGDDQRTVDLGDDHRHH